MMEPKTVREMLDVIDGFLALATDESRGLWDVLMALRGPDVANSKSEALMRGTTEVIRTQAFPLTARSVMPYRERHFVPCLGASFALPSYPFKLNSYAFTTHFGAYASVAGQVLGLCG